MMKRYLILVLMLGYGFLLFAQESDYTFQQNLSYYSETINASDEYIAERCVLDLYFPNDKKGFPTVVWFHGGGLTGGNKSSLKS